MVAAHPVARVFEDEGTHAFATSAVVVERAPPGGAIAVGRVRCELAEVSALRAEVVVDDVEEHGEPRAVARGHEFLQAARPAVARLHGIGIDAVVAPAALPGELRDRHELDRGDAQLAQLAEPPLRRRKGAALREGADVQLVEHERVARAPPGAALVPAEAPWEEDGRWPVDAVRLPARRGVRAGRPAVFAERVALPFGDVACPEGEVTVALRLHRDLARLAAVAPHEHEGHRARPRRPHAPEDGSIVEGQRPAGRKLRFVQRRNPSASHDFLRASPSA